MANVNPGCRSLQLLRMHTPILTVMLGVFVNSAAAQAPGNLKWWSDGGAATAVGNPATADVRGRALVQDVAGGDSFEPAPQVPPADLEWWSGQCAESELNWWKAKRATQSLRWWSQDQPAVRQVAAQQSPFGRKPDEATPETPPKPAPTQSIDGRTPGAADVDFDPFDVVPQLKAMSDIAVTLDPSPPVPTDATAAEPAFTGTAAEYFASQGSTFLAPHHWPQRTPEAAAYQFCSRPLWYEDANVERCGETAGCLQPVVSGTYFFANSLLLPYRFAAEPQCTAVPQKQFCPPGCRYTHAQNYLPPWSPAGAVAEGAAITGLIFLVP